MHCLDIDWPYPEAKSSPIIQVPRSIQEGLEQEADV